MYSTIQNRFADAVSKGSLIFSQTKQIPAKWNGVSVIYTLAPSLGKKPTRADNEAAEAKPETTKSGPAKSSPWLPIEEDLLIERDDGHSVVLNKFAIAKYHFLLVTNEFAKQDSLLLEQDLGAAFSVLRKANKESGKRHIGFYNSGPNSGASVAHRHIQFLTLPDGFKPFPDSTKDVKLKGLAVDERVPFANFICGLPEDADAETLAMRYSEAIGRVITTCGRERKPISYNLVFTEEWLLATPRSQDSVDGISINALATIGLLLAKDEQQLSDLEKKGLEIVLEAGFAYEDAKLACSADEVQGYTLY